MVGTIFPKILQIQGNRETADPVMREVMDTEEQAFSIEKIHYHNLLSTKFVSSQSFNKSIIK